MSSMNYKGYTARIEFSENDGVFWGKVLGLPPSTSISFEGETVAQLTQDFHNAVDFYIAGQCLVFQRCSRRHPVFIRGRVMFAVFEHDFREVRSQSGNR